MNVGHVGERGHGFDGQVELGRGGREAIAIEAFGGNASDGNGLGVDKESAADNRAIASVGTLPSFVAHDRHNGSAFAIVLIGKEAADVRAQTESAKVIAGDEFAHDGACVFLGAIAANGDGTIAEACLDGREIFELGEILSEELIRGSGKEGIVAAIAGAGRDTAVVGVAEADEGGGISDGEIFEKDGVDESEDGGVGANAEGEGEDGGGGEARSFGELTRGEAEVLCELVEPGPAPGGACVFVDESAITKSFHGGVAGLLRGHAGSDVLGDLLLEMELEFVVKFVDSALTAEKGLEFEPERLYPSHDAPLRFLHDEIDGGGEAIPVGEFLFELGATGSGEGIELGDAAGFGFGALALDPAFLLEAMEGGVEGALLDLEDFAGDLLDALGDSPTVLGLEGDGFEDEEVESALDEVVRFAHSMIIYTSDCR